MAKVTIYSTATCPWCKTTKKFFDDNGVQYEDKDVGADLAARQDMITKSGQMAVPVIDVEGRIIVGYDELQLREALDLKR
jgi:glutaredoxin-like YruB-family protein